jgi:hypothetical protein
VPTLPSPLLLEDRDDAGTVERQRVLHVGLDLGLLAVRQQRSGAGSDTGTYHRAGEQRRREDQPDDRTSDRAPARALAGFVEVVVDVNLAVVAAADEDEPVDLDHVVLGKLLDRIPVASGGVGIVVGRDVEIDGSVDTRCHGIPPP